jgi:hypothetical protein
MTQFVASQALNPPPKKTIPASLSSTVQRSSVDSAAPAPPVVSEPELAVAVSRFDDTSVSTAVDLNTPPPV